MKAQITKNGNYYTLNMNGREMGGTNKSALVKYAKSQGFIEVSTIDKTVKQFKVEHGL